MDKQTLGLPGNFAINVAKPVELGDYLDETGPAENGIPTQQSVVTQAKSSPNPMAIQKALEPTPSIQNGDRKRRPRKQVNMSPETIRMLEQFVSHIQEFGPQRDVAASEVIEALLALHYPTLQNMRFGSLPARGRWGSPTANAFIHALSRVFGDALVGSYRDGSS